MPCPFHIPWHDHSNYAYHYYNSIVILHALERKNSTFILGQRKITKNLDRVGRPQDLPDANRLLTSSPAFKRATLLPFPVCTLALFWNFKSKSKLRYDRWSSRIWGPRPDFYYCQTVACFSLTRGRVCDSQLLLVLDSAILFAAVI
jgi:hypothetical protein